MSPSGCVIAKSEEFSSANQWVGRLRSAARVRTCKYELLREVWESMAVPSIMHGIAVMAWTEIEVEKLEVGQNKVVRMVLNAPRYAPLRGNTI